MDTIKEVDEHKGDSIAADSKKYGTAKKKRQLDQLSDSEVITVYNYVYCSITIALFP